VSVELEEENLGIFTSGKCPKCGGPVYVGFGLAGGGYGPYQLCLNEDDCDYFHKEQEEVEEP
jgi:hypothetical protein